MADNQSKMINYYLVAFIDLLGQQEALSRFKRFPNFDNKEEISEFENIAKSTFGVILSFYKTFTDFFKEFSSQEEKSPYSMIMTGHAIKFQRFSDGVVVFVSLHNEVRKIPTQGVFGILAACASTLLLQLSQGRPLRGGVEIGIGMELNDNEIYGPAVSDAYNLESKIAKYPRIVIGKELINFLHMNSNLFTDNNPYNAYSKALSDICHSLIAIDDDGYPFIDFLGEGCKKYVYKNNEHVKDLVVRAYNSIAKESEKWKSNRNSKLAFRYTLLRNYFEARLRDVWDIEFSV